MAERKNDKWQRDIIEMILWMIIVNDYLLYLLEIYQENSRLNIAYQLYIVWERVG